MGLAPQFPLLWGWCPMPTRLFCGAGAHTPRCLFCRAGAPHGTRGPADAGQIRGGLAPPRAPPLGAGAAPLPEPLPAVFVAAVLSLARSAACARAHSAVALGAAWHCTAFRSAALPYLGMGFGEGARRPSPSGGSGGRQAPQILASVSWPTCCVGRQPPQTDEWGVGAPAPTNRRTGRGGASPHKQMNGAWGASPHN